MNNQASQNINVRDNDTSACPQLSTETHSQNQRTQDIVTEHSTAKELPLLYLLAAATLCVFTWITVDWFAQGTTEVEFLLYGAPGIGWYAIPVFFSAWALSQLSRPTTSFRNALFWALLAVTLLVLALSTPGDSSLDIQSSGLFWLYFCLTLLFVSWRVSKQVQWRGVGLALLVTIGFFWMDQNTYVSTSFWYPVSQDTEYPQEQWARTEGLLFSQAEHIDQAVNEMPASSLPTSYFVGFAGDAHQKVFAEEIKFATATLAERYDNHDRSLLYLNDARATDDGIIASVSGLAYGLKRLGQKMDTDHDILFMALSSHGSAKGYLSVSNGVLPLVDLHAHELRKMLDDAGIKWRILFVSACYSGTFIETLANPNTLIVTAAAADKTSFGCSNERDLTYFGEAFYRDSLLQTATIRSAYEQAKTIVTERELAAGYEPSNPAAFFGINVEEKLAAFGQSQ